MNDRLTFTRESERRTSDDKLREQLVFIASRAIAGSRGRGWGYEIGPIDAINGYRWEFSAWIRFYRTREIDPSREEFQRREIYEWAAATGHNSRFGNSPWKTKIPRPQAQPVSVEVMSDSGETKEDTATAPVDPLDDEQEAVPLSSISRIQKGQFYSHLYGLDPQINMLVSAIQAAADSDMSNRFHSLLHGEPGNGKTDILLSTSRLLDSLGVSHLMVDATSMTDAGLRKSFLDEESIVPDVVMVEEIEKTPENNLRILLGLMDDRATISQHNARRVATRKIPALVLATANDYNLLRRMMYGALLSRFSNEIYCPRPDRAILHKILAREIAKVKGGDLAWIEPTLRFCFDERHITDPRMLKRICLCGKDRLISGEYQRDLEQTMRVETVTEPSRKMSARPALDLSTFD